MAELAFTVLLYRYFFFDWLFRDVNKGNVQERSVSWRHNKTQARWLPTYLRRWVCMSGTLFILGSFCETFLKAPLLSAFFFVPMTIGIGINTIIGTLMLGFKSLQGPL